MGEQTYRNVKSLIEPVNQSIVVSGESGAGKVGGPLSHPVHFMTGWWAETKGDVPRGVFCYLLIPGKAGFSRESVCSGRQERKSRDRILVQALPTSSDVTLGEILSSRPSFPSSDTDGNKR